MPRHPSGRAVEFRDARRQSQESDAALIITTMLALGLGVGLIVYTLRSAALGRISLAWPSVTGEVSRALLVQEESGEGPLYRPSVSYRYSVDGRIYAGSNAFFGSRFGIPLRASVSARVSRLSSEGHVPVFYDPQDPSRSVLDPGLHWPLAASAATGFGLLVWGLLRLMN